MKKQIKKPARRRLISRFRSTIKIKNQIKIIIEEYQAADGKANAEINLEAD